VYKGLDRRKQESDPVRCSALGRMDERKPSGMTAARQSHLAAGILVIILTLFVTPCLKADIYVYIDKDGVYHFTNVPTSERYKVYMRENAPMPFFSGNSREYRRCHFGSGPAARTGIFPLLKALIHVESSFNPQGRIEKGRHGIDADHAGDIAAA
jgi:hypothetical protein